MFDLDNLFLENSFFDDDHSNDATLTTTDEGFVWCDCSVDESQVIDGDPFEFITEAMYQNVVNANNISLAILADNYRYLKENGVEMVYEAEEQKKQTGKKMQAIKDFFAKVKEKIKQFFETVIDKMQKLQAKFLMLFKKARESAKKNFNSVTSKSKEKAPAYLPKNVVDWAEKQFDNLVSSWSSEEFDKSGQYLAINFDTELTILKNYGKYISDVKKLKNTALKALDKQEKDMQKDIDSDRARNPLETETRKDTHANYAKIANSITLVSKEAINLIMSRVNFAAKMINKAVFYKDKSDNKDEKKARGESASFLDNLEMI